MHGSASLSTGDVERDFEELRRVRRARREARRRSRWLRRGTGRWLRSVWVCASLLAWSLVVAAPDLLFLGALLDGIAWRLVPLASVAWLGGILLRAPGLDERGRPAALVQVGMSTGAALLLLTPAHLSIPILAEALLATPVVLVQATASQLLHLTPLLLYLLALAAPLGAVALLGLDAFRRTRRLGGTSLGAKDVGRVLLGLGLSLPVLPVAFLSLVEMSGLLAP